MGFEVIEVHKVLIRIVVMGLNDRLSKFVLVQKKYNSEPPYLSLVKNRIFGPRPMSRQGKLGNWFASRNAANTFVCATLERC